VTEGRFVVDGRPIEFVDGDSVAVAIVRARQVPGRGGTLCLAGDCGNCLATVDGVAYVRTCQTPARPGTVVERHPDDRKPRLPIAAAGNLTQATPQVEVRVNHLEADLVIVGAGESGRAAATAAAKAGQDPFVMDSADGVEVMGIYPGPGIVAWNEREIREMVHVRAAEVVVATGAAEVHPVCEGSGLAGILTVRAAELLEAAGVDL